MGVDESGMGEHVPQTLGEMRDVKEVNVTRHDDQWQRPEDQ